MTNPDPARDELQLMAARLEALEAQFDALQLRVDGKERRDELLCELASMLGPEGRPSDKAAAIWAIWAGARPAPLGAQRLVRALAGVRRIGPRQIQRVLQDDATARAADSFRAVCQWPASRNDAHRDPDEDLEDAPE